MALAIHPEQDNIIEKAGLLLQGLAHEQQCDFIERETAVEKHYYVLFVLKSDISITKGAPV